MILTIEESSNPQKELFKASPKGIRELVAWVETPSCPIMIHNLELSKFRYGQQSMHFTALTALLLVTWAVIMDKLP